MLARRGEPVFQLQNVRSEGGHGSIERVIGPNKQELTEAPETSCLLLL